MVHEHLQLPRPAFESRSPEANITTGGDAIWWGFVTITTLATATTTR
jgi:hypothetical protein